MGWRYNPFTWVYREVIQPAGEILVENVINPLIDVGTKVVDLVEKTFQAIGTTVQNIINDPIPTILTIGGAMVGIPPYVTAAAVTAARGGNLEDVAKSAAISYAGTQAMSAVGSTQLGTDIQNALINNPVGDFTDTVMNQFDLTPDQAVAVSRAATSALNSSIIGGVRSVLTGQDVATGITSGFTSGLVYSSTDSYFDSLNKDQNWGLSPTALNMLKGAASTGLQSAITGKGDPAQAIGNYIAYASIKIGGTELVNSAKTAFNEMTGAAATAQQKQNDYKTAQTEYNNRVDQFNSLRSGIETDIENYNTNLNDIKSTQEYQNVYEPNTGLFANYNSRVDQYKATADTYNAYVDISNNFNYFSNNEMLSAYSGMRISTIPECIFKKDANGIIWMDFGGNAPVVFDAAKAANMAISTAKTAAAIKTYIDDYSTKINSNLAVIQPRLDELKTTSDAINTKKTSLNEIKAAIEVPNGSNLAQTLKDTSDAYQTALDNFNAKKTVADTAAVNVDKSLSEVATRDATIDLVNTGAIKITGTNADGSYALSNGMYLSNGKFFQDGQQLFANAAGIDQGAINVADNNGNMVSFDPSAGRVMSTTDIKARIKNDYGVDVSDATANSLAGKTWDNVDKSVVDSAVDQIKTTTVTGSLKDFLAYNADKPNTGVFKEPDGSYSVMALDRAMKFTDKGDLISQFTTGGGDRSDHPSASAVSAAVSKDMTDTTERATGMWGQLMATGAQGAGELLQNYATAISLSTGLDMQSSLYRAGKAMEDWGKNKDSTDVKNQTDAINAAVTNAGKNSNFLEQVQIIGRALKDNPLGFASFIGKEVTQDGPGLALGFAVAAGVSALGGAGLAAGAAALGVATAFEAIETLGSSGKAVYDNLIKSGATPEEARDKALVAGAMNAAMNAPIDAITNKMIFTRYLGGITDGIKGIAAKYGSATLAGGLAEFLQTVPQALVEDKFSGKPVDIKNALAQGIFSTAIGSGASSSNVAINDAVVVAKDFSGNDVTFGELKSGTKSADLSTLNPNAVIGTNANGSQMTMSGLTQSSGVESIAGDSLSSVLPQSLTANDSIISISDAGIPITLGEAQSKIDSLFAGFNLDQTKIDVLSPIILNEFVNGNSGDVLANDVSTILNNAGLEAQQVYAATKSFVPTWTATKPLPAPATKADIDAAIAGIKFPVGITATDVSNAIATAMAANPGLTAAEVATQISNYMSAHPNLTAAEVNTAITNATKNFATKSEIETAIANIQFPVGLSKTDVSTAISDYMKANPGLSTTDVVTAVTAYMTANPQLTTADINTAISTATANLASKTDVSTAVQTAKDALTKSINDLAAGTSTSFDAVNTAIANLTAAGLTATQVNDLITASAANQNTAFKTALTEAQAGNTTAIEALSTSVANVRTSLTTAIDAAIASGLAGDAALQAAIAQVASDNQTTSANILSTLGTTSDQLKTDFSTQLGEVKTQIGNVQTQLTSAIDAAIASGLVGDAALKSAIDKVASDNQVSSDNLLLHMGKTADQLKTDFSDKLTEIKTQVTDVQTQLTAAIEAAKTQGLVGDAALQAAIAKVASDNQISSDNVLTQLGKTTDQLKTDFSTQLGEVKTQIGDVQTQLTAAIEAAKTAGLVGDAALKSAIDKVASDNQISSDNLLLQMGKTADQLKTDFSDKLTEIKTQVTGVQTQLTAAIEAAKTAGLVGDAALQAAITAVAGDLGTTKADLLTQLGTTEAGLRSEFATQIGGVQTQITDVQTALTQAIADAKAAGLVGDAALQAAIAKVASDNQISSDNVLTQLGKTTEQLRTDFSTQLGGVQQQVTDMNAQLTQAIADARAEGLTGNNALQSAINAVATKNQITSDSLLSTIGKTAEELKTDFSSQLTTAKTGIDARIDALVQSGIDLKVATQQAIAESQQQVTGDITQLGNRVNTRIDELVRQGVTQQAATTQAIGELGGTITDVQRTLLEKIASDKALADKAAADKAAADAKTAADAKAARTAQSAQVGYSMVSPSAAQLAEPAPKMPEFKSPFMSSPIMQQAAFAGPLAGFLSQVQKDQYTENPYAPKNSIAGEAPQPQERPMQQQQEPSSYFNYGQDNNIDQILNPGTVTDPLYKTELLTAKKGGLATPLMAGGGTTRYGKYAGGGLNVINHSGKDRIDFRTGNAVTGPGDGQSDDIPAMLADGEFVFPADVVAALGNGSTKAGSDKLYDMMHSIRAHTRSAKPQDLPPAAKNPLDYLKTSRKARR